MEKANIEAEKSYELRDLIADDIFPALKVLSKINIKKLKGCFESADVRNAITNISKKNPEEGSGESLESIGISIAFDVADLLLENLPNCRDDLYIFLAQLSGKKIDDIATLPASVFIKMIYDVVKKKEFADFFGAVTKYLK